MRAKNEYKQLTESYEKVLREEAGGPVWDPLARQWVDSAAKAPEPAGEDGYDPDYKEAAYAKMLELLNALEDLKKQYAGRIDQNDGFFSMIDQIIGIAGTEGEEEPDEEEDEKDEGIKVTDPDKAAEWAITKTPL